MWSTLLFYPADVAKIRLQAEADAHEEEEEEQQEEGGSSPLGAAASEGPTGGEGGTKGGHKGGGGPKSFFGEVLVVLKRPDLWYAGLGEFPYLLESAARCCHALATAHDTSTHPSTYRPEAAAGHRRDVRVLLRLHQPQGTDPPPTHPPTHARGTGRSRTPHTPKPSAPTPGS